MVPRSALLPVLVPLLAAASTLGESGEPNEVPHPAASEPSPERPGAGLVLTPDEVELALELSPLPAPPPDPTNRVYEDPGAARLGQAIFFDPRFSANGKVSCATCHDPEQSFADGRKRGVAIRRVPRNTMSLWNVAYNRWFFWDGRKDTLWSQALAPIEDEREHGFSRLEVAHLVLEDPEYARAYRDVFGDPPDFSDRSRFPDAGRPVPGQARHELDMAWAAMDILDRDEVDTVFANVGKAIAAYERLLISRDSAFDRFVEGLREKDEAKLDALSESAQRGFSVFAGKGRCIFCHDGPNFTDREFHTNRVPTEEEADLGRPRGVRQLEADGFNTRSRHADDGGVLGRSKLSLAPVHAHFPGIFKTPSLRNVTRTAPYMHEGQLATLEEVIEFYSTLEGAVPVPRDTERLLVRLDLTEKEKADLLAFLDALTDENIPDELRGPPATPYLPPAAGAH